MGRVRTSKAKIAAYWASDEGMARLPRNAAAIDWGEPMCFACGWCATDPDEPPELWGVWNRAFLERCHLVPASLGGADEPSNLVLLCSQCHFDAPDVADPRYMLAWIARREPWSSRAIAAVFSALEDAGLKDVVAADDFDWLALHASLNALRPRWSASHGRHVSEATMAASVIEALRRMRGDNAPLPPGEAAAPPEATR